MLGVATVLQAEDYLVILSAKKIYLVLKKPIEGVIPFLRCDENIPSTARGDHLLRSMGVVT